MPDPIYEAIAREKRELAKVAELEAIRARLDAIEAKLDQLLAAPKPRKA